MTLPRLAVLMVAAAAVLAAGGCKPTAERQLTIVLVEYEGPEASSSAQRLAQELTSQGLPDVFIVQGAQYASVCVGRYASWQDPKADAMLRRVRQIRDAQGQYPFAGVMLMPVPEERPENQWPLEKAKGLFTLHIASWEAPGRMAAAQAYAAELRSRGYEAYVYHGPRLSMVTLGAYGPEIFDAPGKIGLPGVKPKVVSPQVLDLIKKFPRMRLEGQETPPEAHVPTQLVKIPGREPPAGPAAGIMARALYRVTLWLVDTRTGTAEGRGTASGVAQSRQEIPTLVGVLSRQVLEAVPKGKTVRVGVAGVTAAAEGGTVGGGDEELVRKALVGAVPAAGAGKIVWISPEATAQMLDAAGLKTDAVLRQPRLLRGFTSLDYVVIGTVTSFTGAGDRAAPAETGSRP